MGIVIIQMKDHVLFLGEIITKEWKYIDRILKNPFLQNHLANLNQTWHKAFLGEGNSILFKGRAPCFFKGR